MMMGLALRTGIASDVTNRFSDGAYTHLRLVSSVFIVFSSVILGLILFNDAELQWVVAALAIVKAVEGASELTYGQAQKIGRLSMIPNSYYLRAAAGFIAYAVVLNFSQSIAVSVLAWAAAWAAIYFYYDRKSVTFQGVALSFDPATIQAMGALAITQFPLAMAAFAGNFALSAPRLVLEKQSNLEIVGIFTSLFFVYQAANMIFQNIGQMQISRYARIFKYKNLNNLSYEMILSIVLYAALCVSGLVVVFIFGSRILNIAYGETIASYKAEFLFLGVAWSFRFIAVSPKMALAGARQFAIVFWVDVLAAVISLIIYISEIYSGDALKSAIMAFLWAQISYFILVLFGVVYFYFKKMFWLVE